MPIRLRRKPKCPFCHADWEGTFERWSAEDHADHKGPKTYTQCCDKRVWDTRGLPDGPERTTLPPNGGFGP